MTEPYVHEPAPASPRYVERRLPLCPTCRCLMRRDLGSNPDAEPGPWRCDLHGEATPAWETLEVPTGDEA